MSSPAHGSTNRAQDAHWRDRAVKVVPGGMYGHMATARLPANFPQFYERSKGTRLWDVDGNEYLDFMCAWGPMLLGYGDPVVDAAADAQRGDGDLMNGFSPRFVELAELLVDTVAHADWAMFAKNGGDATTAATVIARAATGRRKILKAKSAYHGSLPWCTPSSVGITAEDRANVVEFDYNDLTSLEAAAATVAGDVAGVIVTPFRHDVLADQELADPAFAHGARRLCDRIGAALILDDVRCGFRLDLAGSWEPLGVRPDLSAFSKAIANGYALSAVVGVDSLRAAAQSIFITGSFWYTAVAMAAGIATIQEMKARKGVETMHRLGTRYAEGLRAQAKSHGLDATVTGPPAMPLLRFADDADVAKAFLFSSTALDQGVFIHPWHNGFLSAAHTDQDIDQALEATDIAFKAVAVSL
jgi:glutamate-1-semialdehyde 2,1-aminomutase